MRGINVGGKNKISMAELKNGVETLGYTEVSTYLNSGNVVFCSDIEDTQVLSDEIECMIKQQFQSDIPVLVISWEKLMDIVAHAPDWWGGQNKEFYDNLIFLFPGLSYDAFYAAVGEPKAEYEKAENYKDVVFWTFHRKDYQKTNWWSKTAGANIKDEITIRTANTVKKIVKL